MRTGIKKRKGNAHRRSEAGRLAFAATACITALAALPAVTGLAASATSRPIDYCQPLPFVTVTREMWGFHAGHAITGPTGSYARGHGHANLSARTADGIMCQVNRPRNKPDQKIILSVDRRFDYSSHYATKWGVPGNIIQLDVRVKRSTDRRCAVGTQGDVTIFASYNGVHRDSVQFSFPAACWSHRHLYTGSDVVTNVPPN